jgi:hypothetical protein
MLLLITGWRGGAFTWISVAFERSPAQKAQEERGRMSYVFVEREREREGKDHETHTK